MKKQILLVLMMMCATCAMAVKFPSNGMGSTTGEGYEPVGGVGPSYNNSSILGNAGASCAQQNPGTWTSDNNGCSACCFTTVTQPCMDEILAIINAGGTPDKTGEDCQKLGFECNQVCEEYLGYSPVDAPVVFLLAMIAAYGALTAYRRRKLA